MNLSRFGDLIDALPDKPSYQSNSERISRKLHPTCSNERKQSTLSRDLNMQRREFFVTATAAMMVPTPKEQVPATNHTKLDIPNLSEPELEFVDLENGMRAVYRDGSLVCLIN